MALQYVTIDDIVSARARIKDFIHVTPIITSSTINALTGRKVFFKCENFQKTGSFKARGAINAVRKMPFLVFIVSLLKMLKCTA